jgi:hypothetical protein
MVFYSTREAGTSPGLLRIIGLLRMTITMGSQFQYPPALPISCPV